MEYIGGRGSYDELAWGLFKPYADPEQAVVVADLYVSAL
jgi:hypothetical protein